MLRSIFPQPPVRRQTQEAIAISQTDFPVRSYEDLRTAINIVSASGSGYGKSIITSGTIAVPTTLLFPTGCRGLNFVGTGLIVAGEFTGNLFDVRCIDFTLEGITIQIPATAVTQNIFFSTGNRTVVRGVRTTSDTASLATVEHFNFTRQALISGCTLSSDGAMGVRVAGVVAGAAILGNDFSALPIHTLSGTYSVIDGNRNCGTITNDVTDAVGLNT